MKLTVTLVLAAVVSACCAIANPGPAQPAGVAEFNAAAMRRSPEEITETLKRATSNVEERALGTGNFVKPSNEDIMMYEAMNGQARVNW